MNLLNSNLKNYALIIPLLFFSFSAIGQVYYIPTDNNNIARANDDGSNTDLMLITGGDAITDIFVDEYNGFIYWVNSGGGTIGRATIDGTSVNQSFVTTGTAPNSMTISNGFIYYTHDGGDIGRADEATGTTVNNTFITGASAPKGIAVDGGLIYWSNSGTNSISLVFAPSGVPVFTDLNFIGGADVPTDLQATSSGDFYWINSGNGTIGARVDGLTDQSFATGVSGTALYIDEDNELLIWNQSSTTLASIDLDGTNQDNSLATGFDELTGGLYAKLNFGIVISDDGEIFTGGCSIGGNPVISFSTCDRNNNATYSLNNGGSVTDHGCFIQAIPPGSSAPGFYQFFLTIIDPDGIDIDAVSPSRIISATSTSVTLSLGAFDIFGLNVFLPTTGEQISMGNFITAGSAPNEYPVFREYTAEVGYDANESGGNQTSSEGFFGATVTYTSDITGQVETVSISPGDAMAIGPDGTIQLSLLGGWPDNGVLRVTESQAHMVKDITVEMTTTSCGGVEDTATRDGLLFTATALPVELLSFKAQLESDKTTLLEWKTASEENNEGFDIERSLDGRNWEKIGFVAGHGTTQSQQAYTYRDGAPKSGKNYYRLLQRDFDGESEYSNVVHIILGEGNSWKDQVQVYPNPVAGGAITVAFSDDFPVDGTLRLHSPIGQLLKEVTLTGQRQTLNIEDLAAGIYLISLSNGSESWQQKLIVQ